VGAVQRLSALGGGGRCGRMMEDGYRGGGTMRLKYLYPKPFFFPFYIDIDPMERLMVASIKNDPEFTMIEPQLFSDPINGSGLRVLLYRRDGKIDVYWQKGVIVNRDTITIGSGINFFQEVEMEPSGFNITDTGVKCHVRFQDAIGKSVELKVFENAKGITPFSFLAPVGKDIVDPKRLFLAHMLKFDFVRKKGTIFTGNIGDRPIKPESFPLLRGNKKVLFARYSAQPVVGVLNPDNAKPLIFTAKPSQQFSLGHMQISTDESNRVERVGVYIQEKTVELIFPDGFPDLLGLTEGDTKTGNWQYNICGEHITGGMYSLLRSGAKVVVKLDVTQIWKPKEMPVSFRIFTKVVKSFRTWPKTYMWQGTVDLENETMTGSWSRRK
jgi:hypothetical protein